MAKLVLSTLLIASIIGLRWLQRASVANADATLSKLMSRYGVSTNDLSCSSVTEHCGFCTFRIAIPEIQDTLKKVSSHTPSACLSVFYRDCFGCSGKTEGMQKVEFACATEQTGPSLEEFSINIKTGLGCLQYRD